MPYLSLNFFARGLVAVALFTSGYPLSHGVTPPPTSGWSVYATKTFDTVHLSVDVALQDYLDRLVTRDSDGTILCTRYHYNTAVGLPYNAPGSYFDAKFDAGSMTTPCVGPTVTTRPYYNDSAVVSSLSCSSSSSDERCFAPYSDATPKNVGSCKHACGNDSVGNPIQAGTGNKFQDEVDYVGPEGSRLTFVRYYNSSRAAAPGVSIGARWRHNFEYRLLKSADGTIRLQRPDGSVKQFRGPAGAPPDETGVLADVLDAGGNVVGWTYDDNASFIERYNQQGVLTRIDFRSGEFLAFEYSTGKLNLLSKVTDQFGRSLAFTDDGTNIMTLTTPSGGVHTYTYSFGNLQSVKHPDNTTRSYLYNEASHISTSKTSTLLTGIIDERGNRYATYKYDSRARAYRSEHAGGADVVTVTYPTTSGGTTTVASALGATHSMALSSVQGFQRPTSVSSQCLGGTCPAPGPTSFTYDANGNVTSFVDSNEARTCTSYDTTRNLPVRRVEALASSADCATALASPPTGARVLAYQWHPTLRLLNSKAEPLLVTTYTRDAAGRVTAVSEQATTDASGAQGFQAAPQGPARATAITYNAFGQVTSIDGPLPGAVDVTSFAYAANGSLLSMTNAQGHVTAFAQHGADRLARQVTYPSGAVASLTYDARGRLTTYTFEGETTSLTYDGANLLTSTALANGETYTYTYDAAQRLVSVTDAQGQKLTHTLNAAGSPTQSVVTYAGGATAVSTSRVFDALNRIQQINAAQEF